MQLGIRGRSITETKVGAGTARRGPEAHRASRCSHISFRNIKDIARTGLVLLQGIAALLERLRCAMSASDVYLHETAIIAAAPACGACAIIKACRFLLQNRNRDLLVDRSPSAPAAPSRRPKPSVGGRLDVTTYRPQRLGAGPLAPLGDSRPHTAPLHRRDHAPAIQLQPSREIYYTQYQEAPQQQHQPQYYREQQFPVQQRPAPQPEPIHFSLLPYRQEFHQPQQHQEQLQSFDFRQPQPSFNFRQTYPQQAGGVHPQRVARVATVVEPIQRSIDLDPFARSRSAASVL
ncbi:hypothetical protein EVAR_81467_1 [Eumeta japonica]|uniref:Uncharacterized protein n=1 Tax=Eumeta variegata TaxID=151549 RepID=A0A4C1W260_EUMVA|nr:hypothetical protein EVAR_81467_1 [Eumeta japonica]